jgi:hypothetical protein
MPSAQKRNIKAYCGVIVHEDSLEACAHWRAVMLSVLNLFQSVCRWNSVYYNTDTRNCTEWGHKLFPYNQIRRCVSHGTEYCKVEGVIRRSAAFDVVRSTGSSPALMLQTVRHHRSLCSESAVSAFVDYVSGSAVSSAPCVTQ